MFLVIFSPFPENRISYCLSENQSWPFFVTQNEIFKYTNPKATAIVFLISQKLEVTIHLSKRTKGLILNTEIIY